MWIPSCREFFRGNRSPNNILWNLDCFFYPDCCDSKNGHNCLLFRPPPAGTSYSNFLWAYEMKYVNSLKLHSYSFQKIYSFMKSCSRVIVLVSISIYVTRFPCELDKEGYMSFSFWLVRSQSLYHILVCVI